MIGQMTSQHRVSTIGWVAIVPPPHHTKLDLKTPILSVSEGGGRGVLKFRLCITPVARGSRIFRLIPTSEDSFYERE
jgi:hypothetical protein